MSDAPNDLPDEIMVWNQQLPYLGTWATTRYPEEAVAYVPKSDLEARTAERDALQARVAELEKELALTTAQDILNDINTEEKTDD